MSTLVTPTQIAGVTVNGAPGVIVLGDDNYLYLLQLNTSTNKQLDTTYSRLPPIYKDGDYGTVTDGGGNTISNVVDKVYNTAPQPVTQDSILDN